MDIVSGTGDVLLGPGWHRRERAGEREVRRLRGDALAYVPAIEPIEYRVSVELEPVPEAHPLQPATLTVLDETGRPLAEAVAGERRTIQFHLPARRPRLHALRFRARGVRVLGIRAEPLRPEVVPLLAGFRVGRGGWYTLEESAGEAFRWVNNDAEIVVTDPGARSLKLDAAPGPALGSKPLTLGVLAGGAELARFEVGSRRRVSVDLPRGHEAPYALTLHAEESGSALTGNVRVLNFRIFHIPPV